MDTININGLLNLDNGINSEFNKLISDVIKRENEIIEDILRNKIEKPIKGEITKGKIKWRGLKVIYAACENETALKIEKIGDNSYGVRIKACFPKRGVMEKSGKIHWIDGEEKYNNTTNSLERAL